MPSTIANVYPLTNLQNESAEYQEAREELRKAELALMHEIERVAEMRRKLPRGGASRGLRFRRGTAKAR